MERPEVYYSWYISATLNGARLSTLFLIQCMRHSKSSEVLEGVVIL